MAPRIDDYRLFYVKMWTSHGVGHGWSVGIPGWPGVPVPLRYPSGDVQPLYTPGYTTVDLCSWSHGRPTVPYTAMSTVSPR